MTSGSGATGAVALLPRNESCETKCDLKLTQTRIDETVWMCAACVRVFGGMFNASFMLKSLAPVLRLDQAQPARAL